MAAAPVARREDWGRIDICVSRLGLCGNRGYRTRTGRRTAVFPRAGRAGLSARILAPLAKTYWMIKAPRLPRPDCTPAGRVTLGSRGVRVVCGGQRFSSE